MIHSLNCQPRNLGLILAVICADAKLLGLRSQNWKAVLETFEIREGGYEKTKGFFAD